MTRRLSRVLAVTCIALGVVVGVLPSPSSAEAPQATGYWARRLPFQGQVEGQSSRTPVLFTSTASPAQGLPIDPTDPTVPVVDGPATTVPLPVPVPTIPTPPITTPPDPGPPARTRASPTAACGWRTTRPARPPSPRCATGATSAPAT